MQAARDQAKGMATHMLKQRAALVRRPRSSLNEIIHSFKHEVAISRILNKYQISFPGWTALFIRHNDVGAAVNVGVVYSGIEWHGTILPFECHNLLYFASRVEWHGTV
eukprot:gnl/TRDRNA2_/TRDRNA2_175263_c14_seq1.p2 gnl/TRDRNA2_/TRDRNA2_175263_c14~~gnl/TRDRNA2_/TRDRNA2_175263_c14_seq1.p2  ORF type:complete len:108 (+),score=6.50 gnl/TRDRNA2_/TRDRNA2_175263_c14_seq1:213-536(+)